MALSLSSAGPRATQALAPPARQPLPLPALRVAACPSFRDAAALRCAQGAAAQPRAVPRAAALASENAVGENPEHADSDYLVLGLAQCYVKDEDSKLQEVLVIEPIPAAAVECMDNGGVTSYLHAVGVTLGTALQEDVALLPEQFKGGRFCEEFEFRAKCCVRTWKRQHAQEFLVSLVPVGTLRSDFNFSTEDKRVLNMENVVNDDDNIKQDISIDVYGRAEGEEASAQEKEIEKLYNV